MSFLEFGQQKFLSLSLFQLLFVCLSFVKIVHSFPFVCWVAEKFLMQLASSCFYLFLEATGSRKIFHPKFSSCRGGGGKQGRNNNDNGDFWLLSSKLEGKVFHRSQLISVCYLSLVCVKLKGLPADNNNNRKRYFLIWFLWLWSDIKGRKQTQLKAVSFEFIPFQVSINFCCGVSIKIELLAYIRRSNFCIFFSLLVPTNYLAI